MTEEGYLDDAKLAAQFASGRAERGEGARRVRAELSRRGADSSVIEPALSGALDADDREAALETARRLLGKGTGTAERLARQLDRKGFSRRAILHTLRELGPDLDVPDEP